MGFLIVFRSSFDIGVFPTMNHEYVLSSLNERAAENRTFTPAHVKCDVQLVEDVEFLFLLTFFWFLQFLISRSEGLLFADILGDFNHADSQALAFKSATRLSPNARSRVTRSNVSNFIVARPYRRISFMARGFS